VTIAILLRVSAFAINVKIFLELPVLQLTFFYELDLDTEEQYCHYGNLYIPDYVPLFNDSLSLH
jgi:hypothetical protein